MDVSVAEAGSDQRGGIGMLAYGLSRASGQRHNRQSQLELTGSPTSDASRRWGSNQLAGAGGCLSLVIHKPERVIRDKLLIGIAIVHFDIDQRHLDPLAVSTDLAEEAVLAKL